jgi:hypothetical protein
MKSVKRGWWCRGLVLISKQYTFRIKLSNLIHKQLQFWAIHVILYIVPVVWQEDLSPPYAHFPLTLYLLGQLHGCRPRSASAMP